MKRVAVVAVVVVALAAALSVALMRGGTDVDDATTGGGGGDHAGMAGMGDDEMFVGPDGRMVMPASHLQAMIEATPAGTTLRVPEGDYRGSVRVDRPITIQGSGTVVLDGQGQGSVLRVTSPDVTIRELTIRGSGHGPVGSPSAILLEHADRARIQGVRIEQSYLGITVRRSEAVVIEDVRITGHGLITGELHAVDPGEGDAAHDMTGHDMDDSAQSQLRGDGIWLWNTTDVLVSRCTISGVRDGIYLTYGVRPRLDGNTIEDSRYAVHDMFAEDLAIVGNTMRGNLSGLVLMYGGPVEVRANTIVESGSPSTGFGVLVKDVGGVTIAENMIADNRVGMHLDDAGRTGGEPTQVVDNTIAMNQLGVLLFPSADSAFSGNGFVENSTQVSVGGGGSTQVRWSIDGIGNHWSDYAGFDGSGDGIGDIPYTASGRLSRLLAEEPLLEALSSGPAFRLLATFEGRWSDAAPAVRDEAPILDSRGPALAEGSPASPAWVAIGGLSILAASAWSLARARRPRKGARRG